MVLATALLVAVSGCGGDNKSSTKKITVSTTPCESKGIDATQGNTGTCVRNGVTYTVANRGQTLQLEELDARLLGYKTAKKVTGPNASAPGNAPNLTAKGLFVVVTLAVKNKTDKANIFGGPGFEQALLGNGKKQYVANQSANALARDSFVRKGRIPPGKTMTGTIYFDTSVDFARNLVKEKAGLFSVNFSDADRLNDAKRLGVIRLWKGAATGGT